MKVKELQAMLAGYDPDATVLISGFETTASLWVAEADTVTNCASVLQPETPMLGNRKLSSDGDASVWIGWRNDYRTDTFLHALATPEDYE
ncbi:MAG TPA: hypothetical protein VGI71_04020 [Scandinavium sp.]|jgi:hypothetical protein|uniref:hypothetical protein n=1 Tax=Enterobacter TaxID=547 RepID=UPI000680A466|nr:MULTISPECIES: hypothetical protein [Enterobacter]NTZ41020.1 hypothetical protein [Enterobacter sp. JMULE2]